MTPSKRNLPQAQLSTVSLGTGSPYVTDVTRSDTLRSDVTKGGRRSKNRFVYYISEEDCAPVGLRRDGERHGRKDVTPGFVPALSYSKFVGD